MFNELLNFANVNWSVITKGLFLTSKLVVLAFVVGIVFGSILASMKVSKSKLLNTVSGWYIGFFRQLPLLFVLLAFYLILPNFLRQFGIYGDVTFIIAVVGFSLFESAYFAEIIRTGINAVPSNQVEAATTLGMSKTQSFLLVVLPQAIRNSKKSIITQLTTLIQDTSLVYVLNMNDFFNATYHSGEASGYTVHAMVVTAIVYVAITFVLNKLTGEK
ncbi:amino acid ABC transporter permease [Aquitalea pelogenes]|uniref:amino acid ABC transporter permease n=1 Tax=Aquitalea pelogenes TaxID=1293573 RepID=UPI0035ADFA84